MQFTVDHADLAAVSYAAQSLPARPPVPVLAGLLLDAAEDTLRISGFDYETSTDHTVASTVAEPGRALVSGRLLADIAARVRGVVQFELAGPRLILLAGSACFTLPVGVGDVAVVGDGGAGRGFAVDDDGAAIGPGDVVAECLLCFGATAGHEAADEAVPVRVVVVVLSFG